MYHSLSWLYDNDNNDGEQQVGREKDIRQWTILDIFLITKGCYCRPCLHGRLAFTINRQYLFSSLEFSWKGQHGKDEWMDQERPYTWYLSQELHTTTELVNLTITLYMVFQGVSPAFWGAFADAWGRRPIYLTTLAVYLGTCIGCALAPNYPALLVLRMLQAFGSSSVIAIGTTLLILFDIEDRETHLVNRCWCYQWYCTSFWVSFYGMDHMHYLMQIYSYRRGRLSSLVASGQILGPCIGPIIGGVLSEAVSWRWVMRMDDSIQWRNHSHLQ